MKYSAANNLDVSVARKEMPQVDRVFFVEKFDKASLSNHEPGNLYISLESTHRCMCIVGNGVVTIPSGAQYKTERLTSMPPNRTKRASKRAVRVCTLLLAFVMTVFSVNVATAPAAEAAPRYANGCMADAWSWNLPTQGLGRGYCDYPNRRVRIVVRCKGLPPLAYGYRTVYSSWSRQHPRAWVNAYCPVGYPYVSWASMQEESTWRYLVTSYG